MKTYTIPIIEIIKLDECDCIRTSVFSDADGTIDNVGRIPNAWYDDAFGG